VCVVKIFRVCVSVVLECERCVRRFGGEIRPRTEDPVGRSAHEQRIPWGDPPTGMDSVGRSAHEHGLRGEIRPRHRFRGEIRPRA